MPKLTLTLPKRSVGGARRPPAERFAPRNVRDLPMPMLVHKEDLNFLTYMAYDGDDPNFSWT